MLFCTYALCYISTTSSYHKLSIQLEGVDSAGAASRSYSIRMYWNHGMMIRVVCWREERLWAEGLQLLSGYNSDVYGCSNQIIYTTSRCRSELGSAFFFLSVSFLFSMVWWKSHCCQCKCYNAYVSTETPIFYCISNPKQYFFISHLMLHIKLDNILWLLQTSYSIFIDIACYNHSRVFNSCFAGSMYITVILAVMLKSAFLLPKNSMCRILPLNKNYIRYYLEPENYLEV